MLICCIDNTSRGGFSMKRQASHTALEVANAFLKLAENEGVSLTNMQLQKLVYISFGFYVAVFNERMFDDEIQAWNFGPVIPNLYHALKKFGAGEVTSLIDIEGNIEDNSPEMKIIETVWGSYKNFDTIQLSNLTHQDGTPWSAVWEQSKREAKIPLDLIRSHYQRLFLQKVNA